MRDVFVCDAVRTPIGRYGGVLCQLRTDDLAAEPIRALKVRCSKVDWNALDDIVVGCTNQAGEDNRNVARMAGLLAGMPVSAAGVTVNRLCGSGMQAVGDAARAIGGGLVDLMIAGGVESMSRSPFILNKAVSAFSRDAAFFDSTIGWRFVNPKMKAAYGIDSMPETAEYVAQKYGVSRDDQDKFALASQAKSSRAQADGTLAQEIVPVSIPQRKGEALIVDKDEHPRSTTLEALAKLKSITVADGTVTAGNSSGINDGACALIMADAATAARHELIPKVRVVGSVSAGVEPRVMGVGPVNAVEKLLGRLNLELKDMDVIELNEAFAAQALAVMRLLRLADDDPRVNPNGGAIALGHPLGMSGARLVTTATYQLMRSGGRYALCAMCIGVGQGIAMVLERS